MNRCAIFTLALSLVAATTAAAEPTPGGTSARSVDPRNRIICRRYVRIGSLVDGYRTCKTRAEWDREQANIRQMSVSDTCRLRGEPSAPGEHTQDC